MTTKVSERADKGFNYYAYMKAEFGAVRMEEEKVVVIPVERRHRKPVIYFNSLRNVDIPPLRTYGRGPTTYSYTRIL